MASAKLPDAKVVKIIQYKSCLHADKVLAGGRDEQR